MANRKKDKRKKVSTGFTINELNPLAFSKLVHVKNKLKGK